VEKSVSPARIAPDHRPSRRRERQAVEIQGIPRADFHDFAKLTSQASMNLQNSV
jgi:hypothetical protein